MRDLAAELLASPRYEVLPFGDIEEAVLEHVPTDVKVTVTTSPKKGLEPTLELAERIAKHGYNVVPHLAARHVRDRGHLSEIVERLRAAGANDVLVMAGDADEPAGEFDGSAPLLRALAELGQPFRDVGITGYPESHAFISDDATIQLMFAKEEHATYIVSQICFDPEVTANWMGAVWERGTRLPIHIGLPAPVPRTKLLRVSARSGRRLGPLPAHSRRVAQAFARGNFGPDPLVRGLADRLGDAGPNARRLSYLHVQPGRGHRALAPTALVGRVADTIEGSPMAVEVEIVRYGRGADATRARRWSDHPPRRDAARAGRHASAARHRSGRQGGRTRRQGARAPRATRSSSTRSARIPTSPWWTRARELYAESGCDGLVGLGGGLIDGHGEVDRRRRSARRLDRRLRVGPRPDQRAHPAAGRRPDDGRHGERGDALGGDHRSRSQDQVQRRRHAAHRRARRAHRPRAHARASRRPSPRRPAWTRSRTRSSATRATTTSRSTTRSHCRRSSSSRHGCGPRSRTAPTSRRARTWRTRRRSAGWPTARRAPVRRMR